MPLSVNNFVHENSGTTASGTTHVVSLAAPGGVQDATTAGNTLVIAIYVTSGSVTPPTGMVNAKSQSGILNVFYKSNLAAGETSWTFTTAGSVVSTWYVAELSGLDPVVPAEATAGATTSGMGNGGTASTGTTPLNAGLYSVAFAVYGIPATASWSGYTNGFEEVADVSAGGMTLAVARLFESSTTRTFESTATLATSGSALTTDAVMVTFRAVDSPVVAPLAHFLGFEWGTHGGAAASGTASMFGGQSSPSGTWGTTYLIQAGSARNSNYGLRIVKAGTGNVMAGNFSSKGVAFGFNVRVVSATGTVVVAELSSGCQVLYDSSATKFGVRCSTTGTASWESGATPLNTWRWIDARGRTDTSTYQVDWRIETGTDTYTEQTPAEETGKSVFNIVGLYLGGAGSQTITADFDDVVLSAFYVAFPLGPHEVKLLTVDPAGTPTVSGTAANFKVITANGTIGAWDATNARNAVDEVPPTISAAADAVAQVTAAATEYMQFPMDTYTLAADQFINGVRMLAAIGSGTGAGAGDFAIRGHDGTTETALAAVSQVTPGSPTAISTTVPRWLCAMWQSANGWTAAELAAAVIRAGFSGDATPDMWMHAVYLEVAVGKTRTQTLFGDMATVEVDPTRLGTVSISATAPAMGTGGASLEYEEAGAPTTVGVPEGTTVTEQVNATFEADVNRVTLYWPPEPDPEA